MVSRSGVLLYEVTAWFQCCGPELSLRREMGLHKFGRRQPLSLRLVVRIEAWFQSLMALLFGWCDVSHIRGVFRPNRFFKLSQALSAVEIWRRPPPKRP